MACNIANSVLNMYREGAFRVMFALSVTTYFVLIDFAGDK